MPNNFEDLLQNIVTKAPRRVWAEAKGDLYQTIALLKSDYDFWHLATITGIENADNFQLLYHMSQKGTGILLSISHKIPLEGGSIKTIIDLYPSAIWYERELKDLFGIQVEGLSAGNRYPLPDEWPQDNYPLRKNWKPAPEVK